jgi:hypothetical protein
MTSIQPKELISRLNWIDVIRLLQYNEMEEQTQKQQHREEPNTNPNNRRQTQT